MHIVPREEPLFELEGDEKRPTHFFYETTNGYTMKAGQTERDVDKRIKEDRQFRGHLLIFKRLCACQRHRDSQGRLKCELELWCEDAFARYRLPASEQYRMCEDIDTAIRFMAGRDPKAMAVLDWARRYGWQARSA